MTARAFRTMFAVTAVAALALAAADGGETAKRVDYLSAQALRARLAEERGQVVVLNLWATWCVSCLREIPDLLAIERELGAQGVSVIGIAMDEPQDLDALVRPFHAKHFPEFRTYLRSESDMDAVASVVDSAWNEVLPTTYIIGRQGGVIERVQGRRTLEQFRELAKRALRGGR
jgi:thiol-disulfide isomerase/thioredoxin